MGRPNHLFRIKTKHHAGSQPNTTKSDLAQKSLTWTKTTTDEAKQLRNQQHKKGRSGRPVTTAVRPLPSNPSVTSSAVDDQENPDAPFRLNGHISLSVCLSLHPLVVSLSTISPTRFCGDYIGASIVGNRATRKHAGSRCIPLDASTGERRLIWPELDAVIRVGQRDRSGWALVSGGRRFVSSFI
ncbi:hypothetical protein B296_00000948 [Ensete ventricosum]|uniref:Uncharacterized protein n=1 Tax=Ensete ventricosum TaxID=4639 RepID=A0A427ANS3_ENSVE|nr:hypothetical protein B296_00000948 [Ensete ventricosum]